jgi:hypothetical protein
LLIDCRLDFLRPKEEVHKELFGRPDTHEGVHKGDMEFVGPADDDDQPQEDELLFVVACPVLYFWLQVERPKVLSMVVLFIMPNDVFPDLVLK